MRPSLGVPLEGASTIHIYICLSSQPTYVVSGSCTQTRHTAACSFTIYDVGVQLIFNSLPFLTHMIQWPSQRFTLFPVTCGNTRVWEMEIYQNWNCWQWQGKGAPEWSFSPCSLSLEEIWGEDLGFGGFLWNTGKEGARVQLKITGKSFFAREGDVNGLMLLWDEWGSLGTLGGGGEGISVTKLVSPNH